MNPMEARARTITAIRSPADLARWFSNPILFYNIVRARRGERPYWKRWHSLMLYWEKARGWNSYALFVEGQDFPRIVIKRPVPTYTSYGIPVGRIWGIIYYNQPEGLFMHAYMENANFGKGFDFEGGAFTYNNNPEMKKKITRMRLEELKESSGIFWNRRISDFYISVLERMLSGYSSSQ